MTPLFKNLTISGWRQFHNVSIDFHSKLTVITGANGAGKSTILGLLVPHFGWHRAFLGTPKKKRKNGVIRFLTGVRPKKHSDTTEIQNLTEVGKIGYSNGTHASLQVVSESQTYNIHAKNQQQVLGTFLSSHRAPPVFQAVSQITAYALNPDQAYAQYQSESVQRLQGNHTGPSPIFKLKESLVSMAMFGSRTDYSAGDDEAILHLRGFIDILKIILPPSLGFKDLSIRLTDVVMETTSGNFIIDAASGGVMALIDIAWQIYTYSLTSNVKNTEQFTVIMDEPENHLHPSMQRSLLGNLIKAFPKAQFIVATHSPFMVSSVQESFVYALRYTDVDAEGSTDEDTDDGTPLTKLVFSDKLDMVNRAGSASDILRDVLGVPVTIPEWVENRLNTLVDKYRKITLDENSLKSLRSEMASIGFADLYSSALLQLVEKND